jgi:hypothetical protein
VSPARLIGRHVAACATWLALASSTAHADAGTRPPAIPRSGPTIDSFVPPGYRIEQQEERDLDGDGRPDAVFQIVPTCEGVDPSVQDTERCEAEGRVLVIVFREAGGGYRLSLSAPISSTVGPHGDSFSGFKLKGRTLVLGGAAFSCAGQVGTDWTGFYRYQQGDWYRIGTLVSRWHRSDECGEDPDGSLCPQLKLRAGESCTDFAVSTNHNTSVEESRWTITADADGKEREVVVRRRLPRAPLLRLADEDLGF